MTRIDGELRICESENNEALKPAAASGRDARRCHGSGLPMSQRTFFRASVRSVQDATLGEASGMLSQLLHEKRTLPADVSLNLARSLEAVQDLLRGGPRKPCRPKQCSSMCMRRVHAAFADSGSCSLLHGWLNLPPVDDATLMRHAVLDVQPADPSPSGRMVGTAGQLPVGGCSVLHASRDCMQAVEWVGPRRLGMNTTYAPSSWTTPCLACGCSGGGPCQRLRAWP